MSSEPPLTLYPVDMAVGATLFQRAAAIGSALSALVVLAGFPLVSMSSVIPGSDAPYLTTALVSVLLGLTLAPAAFVDYRRMPGPLRVLGRHSGLVVAGLLVVTGGLLWMGASGVLGERAPSWVAPAAAVAWCSFYGWTSLSSIASRNSSRVDRSLFWLGAAAGAAVALLLLVSIAMFYFVPGYVETGAGIVPILLVSVLTRLTPVAWLLTFAARLWGLSTAHPSAG